MAAHERFITPLEIGYIRLIICDVMR
jgi:hypothetical protein